MIIDRPEYPSWTQDKRDIYPENVHQLIVQNSKSSTERICNETR
jgi:hypothetical protein